MKKTINIVWIIVLAILLTSCKGDTDNKLPGKGQGKTTVISNENKKDLEPALIDERVAKTDPDWFVGEINGKWKVHLKMEEASGEITGLYYYDTYKKDIVLSGSKTGDVITFYEEDSSNRMDVKVISEDLLEGIWTDNENIYPLYLIRGGSKVTIPAQPQEGLMLWKGGWKGKNSDYYAGTDLTILPLYKDVVFMELLAYNGTHTGGFSTVTQVVQNKATFIGENEVVIDFTLKNKEIQLESEDYSYYCGMGVSFDSTYIPDFESKSPTALEAGLVNTKEQEQLFKELTGDYYQHFIDYAQYYSEEEPNEGEDIQIRIFGILGYAQASIVMIRNSDNTFWAAIDDYDKTYYFTNDPNATDPPEPIMQWYGDRGSEIVRVE